MVVSVPAKGLSLPGLLTDTFAGLRVQSGGFVTFFLNPWTRSNSPSCLS